MSEVKRDVVVLRLPIPLESMATVQEFVERVYGTGDTRIMFDGDHMRIIAPEDGWGERKRGRGKLPSAVNAALRLRYVELRDGKAKVTVEDMESTILYISEIARHWFDHVGGINYVETKLLTDGQDAPLYVFVMQRYDGKTPHELRQEAEADRDAAFAVVERARALLTRKSTSGESFSVNQHRTELDMLRALYDDTFADELASALGLVNSDAN